MRQLVIVVLVLLLIPIVNASYDVSITTGGTKYRPWMDVPSDQNVVVHTFRGEWPVVQIITRAENEDVTGVDVSVSTPTRGSDILTDFELFKPYNHLIEVPSRADGEHGEWPDALIPKVDRYHNEKRNAFPFDIIRQSKGYNSWGFDLAPDSPRWAINRRNNAQNEPSLLGEYTGSSELNYHIKITGEGAAGTATFIWSDDWGTTWSSEQIVPNNTDALSLSNGLSVSFPSQEKDYYVDDEYEFFVAPYRNEVVWMELFVPENATPGAYESQAIISADEKNNITLNITIIVHDLNIPLTSSIPVWYYSSRQAIKSGHEQKMNPPGDWEYLIKDYIEEGLYHRITQSPLFPTTLWNGSALSSDGNDMSYWVDYAKPYLNGDWEYGAKMGFTPIPLPKAASYYHTVLRTYNIRELDLRDYTVIINPRSGDFKLGETLVFENGGTARALVNKTASAIGDTNITPLIGMNLTGNESGATGTISKITPSETFMLPQLYDLLKAEGWHTNTLNWLIEEPRWTGESNGAPAPWHFTEAVQNVAASMRDIFPEVKQVATEFHNEEWDGAVDAWISSDAVCGWSGGYDGCYDDVGDADRWSYSACGTHHCTRTGEEERNKLPTHILDTQFSSMRGLFWLKQNGNFVGDLYWNTVSRYVFATHRQPIDPWDSIYDYAGNGDGTLFYPGRPNVIGGTTHIPISSIRIKAIRKGLEDYELFKLGRETGHETLVMSEIANTLGTDWYAYDPLPTEDTMETARLNVINAIAPYVPVCGDAICEYGENETSCYLDCSESCYDPAKPGDLTCDNIVDIFDLTLVGSRYNCSIIDPCWDDQAYQANACTASESNLLVDDQDRSCVDDNFGNTY